MDWGSFTKLAVPGVPFMSDPSGGIPALARSPAYLDMFADVWSFSYGLQSMFSKRVFVFFSCFFTEVSWRFTCQATGFVARSIRRLRRARSFSLVLSSALGLKELSSDIVMCAHTIGYNRYIYIEGFLASA